jgi:hypothetical protein
MQIKVIGKKKKPTNVAASEKRQQLSGDIKHTKAFIITLPQS